MRFARNTMPSSSNDRSREEANSLFGEAAARVLKPIAVVAAPATVLAALLFYFGWVYTQEFYNAFGIDQSILGLSNQDYVLRSTRVVFLTLRVALVAVLFALFAHFLTRRLMKSQRLERYPRISSSLPWLFVLLGLGLALPPNPSFLRVGSSIEARLLTQPIAFTLGFALVGYGLYLSELHAVDTNSGSRQPLQNGDILIGRRWSSELHAVDTNSGSRQPLQNGDISRWRRWSLVIALGLVVVGLFWGSAMYAQLLGRYAVNNFTAQIKYRPRITVYSQEPLSLQAHGVTMERISEAPKTYQYRYTGLRFLARSGSKYFLLPELWTPDDGTTIILSETDAIRIETAAGEIWP
ncbi:MAG: hypothetical protein JSU72_11755 [Deltaproteobacteria bacterium]|nr:MAG: hypothetical protein JSU72_11755 [Deltaproteobacteria bacterium]